MVGDYELDEDWMNASLGPFVDTEIHTKPVVDTETENMRHKQQNVVSTPQEPEKWTDPASLLSKEKFDELRQKLADIPDSEFDVSTIQEPTLHQFTQDEIAAFCRKLEDLRGIAKPGGMIFVKARQIIRQLQKHVTSVSRIAEALAKNLPDDKRISLNRFRVQELVDILEIESAEAGMERMGFEPEDLSAPVFTSPTGPEGQG